jgi:hypothetical protein
VTSKKHGERSGLLSRIAAGMTSMAGIATAIATITTSAAAVLGVAVQHKDTQLHQANAQASHQAQTIQQLQGQVHAVAASSPAPSASSTPAAGNAARFLSNLTPTINNSLYQNSQQVISAQPYPNSISLSCDGPQGNGQPGVAYDVAGSGTLTAEVGIADNAQGVTSVIATVTFSNEAGQQLGKPIQVSLGHPVQVALNITGVTQLGMTCVGRDAHTSQVSNGFYVALGNAGIS